MDEFVAAPVLCERRLARNRRRRLTLYLTNYAVLLASGGVSEYETSYLFEIAHEYCHNVKVNGLARLYAQCPC
ncbi:hypothetical protein OF001_U440003 [Pseudomonas sp. OF001]|nr:hypothetical protein OF001_U440003 [Pseudomonas sp. OF001]